MCLLARAVSTFALSGRNYSTGEVLQKLYFGVIHNRTHPSGLT